MNVNDHEEHGDDETALKRAQLRKVEDAIAHGERTLADLRDVRDALRAELRIDEERIDDVQIGRWYHLLEPGDGLMSFRPERRAGNNVIGDLFLKGRMRKWIISLPYRMELASYRDVDGIERMLKEAGE